MLCCASWLAREEVECSRDLPPETRGCPVTLLVVEMHCVLCVLPVVLVAGGDVGGHANAHLHYEYMVCFSCSKYFKIIVMPPPPLTQTFAWYTVVRVAWLGVISAVCCLFYLFL